MMATSQLAAGPNIDVSLQGDNQDEGVVDATDSGTFFLPQFTQATPGPSGLVCAGQPGCMYP